MKLSPDQLIYWRHGFYKINETILTTWILMIVLLLVSWLITRKLSTGSKISKWQSILEILVIGMRNQISDIGLHDSRRYVGFLGTLFIFLALANFCTIIPGYVPPTASLSTTAALAVCVFVAVPYYGISKLGLWPYVKSYMKPTFIMLPFNVISEFSRTLALAVRLFGNMMSGAMIISILIIIAPLFFPIVMNVLGLLTGLVQAYIFSILAGVYIAAATQESETQ